MTNAKSVARAADSKSPDGKSLSRQAYYVRADYLRRAVYKTRSCTAVLIAHCVLGRLNHTETCERTASNSCRVTPKYFAYDQAIRTNSLLCGIALHYIICGNALEYCARKEKYSLRKVYDQRQKEYSEKITEKHLTICAAGGRI